MDIRMACSGYHVEDMIGIVYLHYDIRLRILVYKVTIGHFGDVFKMDLNLNW